MKTTIILFILGFSTAFAQVDCNDREPNFSGKCESFNQFSGIRSAYSYKKGSLHGTFEEAYKNGQMRAKGKYKSGLLTSDFFAWYSDGSKMTDGKFKSGTGDFTMYHLSGEQKVIGRFEDGQPIGSWRFFDSDGQLTREMEIENKRINMFAFLVGDETMRQPTVFNDFFDSNGSGFSFSFGGDSDSIFANMQERLNESMKQMEAQLDRMMQGFSDSSFFRSFQFDTTFSFNNSDNFGDFFDMKIFGDSSLSRSFQFDTIIRNFSEQSNPYFNQRDRNLVDFPDVEPSFVGGEEVMQAYIKQELANSKLEDLESVSGTIFIEAIVEIDGSISNSRVALGISDKKELNQEALRIVNSMPLWRPATVNDEPVRSRCIIPVKVN